MEKKDKKEVKKTVNIRFRFPTSNEPRPTQLLFTALSILPNDVLAYFQKNPIMFCGETKEHIADAVRFTEESKECKYIVHFHSHLWDYTDEKIISIILVQAAHCYLNNSPGLWSFEHSQGLVPKSEADAQDLAIQWFQEHQKKKITREIRYKVLSRSRAEVDQYFPNSYQ